MSLLIDTIVKKLESSTDDEIKLLIKGYKAERNRVNALRKVLIQYGLIHEGHHLEVIKILKEHELLDEML